MKYAYFVHFTHSTTHSTGSANTWVGTEKPVRSFEDIKLMTKSLQSSGLRDVVISNYQLMSGPGVCRSCGK